MGAPSEASRCPNARVAGEQTDPERQFETTEELRRQAAEILSRSEWRADERRREQRKLIAAEVDARLDGEGAAVVVTDLAGCVRRWNSGAERLYGWSRAEAIGRTTTDLLAGPQDTQVVERILDGVRRTGSWEGEFWVRRKDGTPLLVYVHTATVEDETGHPLGLVGVSVGVSPHGMDSSAG